MTTKYFFGSLTRISDLQSRPFTVEPLPRSQWATGDYVVGRIVPPVHLHCAVELTTGRMAELLEGDRVVGAFGVRRATLEAVGDWQSIACLILWMWVCRLRWFRLMISACHCTSC
ncbi:hypothetical protein [Leptodesmis sp.]|uniref:hypothetical protein n=1 Tax=Leptodesmis sp. TaxID=3100501 RepID=UPI00405355A5